MGNIPSKRFNPPYSLSSGCYSLQEKMNSVRTTNVSTSSETNLIQSSHTTTQTDSIRNGDLHKACWEGRIKVVRALLKGGYDANITYENSKTSLTFSIDDFETHSGYRYAWYKANNYEDYEDIPEK